MATLEKHAFPILGGMSVDRIRSEDMLRVLTPIWTRIPETARRVRQRIRAVLRWSWAHGYVSENVAGEGIDGALPAMPHVKEHFRALRTRRWLRRLRPWRSRERARRSNFASGS